MMIAPERPYSSELVRRLRNEAGSIAASNETRRRPSEFGRNLTRLLDEAADALDLAANRATELDAAGPVAVVESLDKLMQNQPVTAYPPTHPNAASMHPLYTRPPVESAGFVLVPREPTEAMWEATFEVSKYVAYDRFLRDWKQMLAAMDAGGDDDAR